MTLTRSIRLLTKTLTHTRFWVCVSVSLYIAWSLTSCGPRKGDAIMSDIDTLHYSTLTRGVETLISDSGVTKYKLVSPVWYTYDRPESKWYFPEGIYLEQFDTAFMVEASVKADTAYYFESKKLWKLVGNVEVLNREGQQFFGNSLFWDQNSEEVYSHEHIRIIKAEGQELNGKYGFRSNQSMTQYSIFSSSGYMDVDPDEQQEAPNGDMDAMSDQKADSIAIEESISPSYSTKKSNSSTNITTPSTLKMKNLRSSKAKPDSALKSPTNATRSVEHR